MSLHTNPQLELAFEYVRETSTHVFLTGKAGTGKTTFLRQVKEGCPKRTAIVAPTGVAAINAGGMTIHSLFQLPFGMYVPNAERGQENRKFSQQKLSLIRSLDLLVIDEISMVRADLLDAVDDSLRRLREDDRPFGNVQLLMIGDLHQLPPVVKTEDWETLRRFYDTAYFFGSVALRKSKYVSIELKHIYRQSDPTFIDLLNKVRDNQLDATTLNQINSRYLRNFQPPSDQTYITLTATNAAAQEINTANLAGLPGKLHRFDATIVGDFPENSYPTEALLEFKEGAQVMFIKNDLQPEKRYFNGKIGRITRISDDQILVRCPGEGEIAVEPDEWQNIKYGLNEETKEIEEQILGSFTQYPLKLAWAITIHKSQGLTFDRAIIDAQAAFAHGQVYVALSRCKSFEGIVLRSKIQYASVKTDTFVQRYHAEAERNVPTAAQLKDAKRLYQRQLVEQLFSFADIGEAFRRLCKIYHENQSSLGPEASQQLNELASQSRQALTTVAARFHPQLVTYLNDEDLPESHPVLRERITKAAVYFDQQLTQLIQSVTTVPKATDNQALRQSLHSQFNKLMRHLFIKRAAFAACRHGFSSIAYQRAQFDGELDYAREFTKRGPDDDVPAGIPHPELYKELLEYRRRMAEKRGVSPRSVLTTPSLALLVTVLPTTREAIRKIHGIARKRLELYGQDLEAIIGKYCQTHSIALEASARPANARPANASPATAQPNPHSGTRELSLAMFTAGKSVEEIARLRTLSLTTIQTHLASYVEEQQLDIRQLLPTEKLEEIDAYWNANPQSALSAAKNHFGAKVTYGELRLVLSYRNSRQKAGRSENQ